MSYSIAKAEVIHYARCLAAELGPCNINVNCVAPALICTSRAIVDGRKGKVAEELIKKAENAVAIGFNEIEFHSASPNEKEFLQVCRKSVLPYLVSRYRNS